MDLAIQKNEKVVVVGLEGELDASTAPAAQQKVLAAAEPGKAVVLDLSGVPYMSSAGLRMLLSTYRKVSEGGGQIVLAGVADEIQDTMAVTGFLKFFALSPTVAAACASLGQRG